MSVALELEFEVCRPRLYALPDQPARKAPTNPRVRRRVVLGAVVLGLLVLLALPIQAFAGSTVAPAPPTKGQVYVVKSGDTLARIAAEASPARAGLLTRELAREVGSSVVVPGEHVYIR